MGSDITPTGDEPIMLIVDDEANIRRVLQAVFAKAGYVVQTAENGHKALEVARKSNVTVLITDLIMPDMNGVEVLQKVKLIHPDVVAIMVTAYATIKTCVDAMRFGAADYITKPFDVDEIRAVVNKAVEKSADQAKRKRVPSVHHAPVPRMSENLSAAMREVETMVSRSASSRATVLIRGESGTGKELVARALHERSERANAPFVAVSCAALSETLLDSELFGHEKNAFTGAANERKGRFELAHGGTLFLDEIGDIAPSVQIKLLRVLQQREFERVGGTRTVKVDVRLIAATNADLESLIKEGTFREDLYYRLNVIQIPLPALRERLEDVENLANLFLTRFNGENDRAIASIPKQTLAILTSYSWPGNVRELENSIERAVVMSEPDAIELLPSYLPSHIRELANA